MSEYTRHLTPEQLKALQENFEAGEQLTPTHVYIEMMIHKRADLLSTWQWSLSDGVRGTHILFAKGIGWYKISEEEGPILLHDFRVKAFFDVFKQQTWTPTFRSKVKTCLKN